MAPVARVGAVASAARRRNHVGCLTAHRRHRSVPLRACVALRMPCADQAAPSPCVVRSGPSRAESAALGDGCENAPD